MKVINRWTRSAAALAAIAPLAIAATGASAAPLRTADTTRYTSASYLHDVLGLPSGDADPAIDTITYGHLQWLLQQSGQYALLIGDPATDAGFVARAQDVEAAANAAGVDTVYWFNPNLSGSVRLAGVQQAALDIRDAGSIRLTAGSQTAYGHAWKNLVARALGNGVSWSATGLGGNGPVVTTVTQRPEVVNDSGATAGQSTEVGNPDGGALYDYSATDTPADVTDTYFVIYDKDGTRGGQPQRVVSWVNLSEETASAATRADVTTAIGTVGGSALDAPSQFEWWKSDVNERASRASVQSNGDVPVLTAADADWRVEQITLPELIHLLDDDATVGKEAVVLFGGAWCPNTRPVLPAINRYAAQNDVHVFNYDTVLDGANIAGGATSGSNPFQTRNNHGSGAHPSFLYGHLFDHYLGNASTEYVPPTGSAITYYPNGDTAATPIQTRRLQVPYLIGYRGAAGDGPHGGVVRQWIEDKGDGTFSEYMSEWQYVNPLPGRIGLTIPADAQIWTTLNDQLARFTWQTDPSTLYPNAGVWTDAGQYLGAVDGADVRYNAPVAPATTGTLSVSSGGTGAIGVGPAALSSALSALGAAAPANLVAARAALIAANEPAADPALIDNLKVVVGAWRLAEVRKENVTRAWGTVADASGVVGGVRAVHAAQQFFAGLPTFGGEPPVQEPPREEPPVVVPPVDVPPVVVPPVVQQPPVVNRPPVASKPTVTRAKARKVAGAVVTAPTRTKGGSYKVTISSPRGGAKATGTIKIVLKKGKATKVLSGRLARGTATVKLPKLARGTWKVTISWPGDARYRAASASGVAIRVK